MNDKIIEIIGILQEFNDEQVEELYKYVSTLRYTYEQRNKQVG